MAAIENLQIIVDVDIGEAVDNLIALKDELRNLKSQISRVDRRGTRGISIDTRVEPIADDLTMMSSIIESWEAGNSIDIDTNVSKGGLAAGLSGASAARAMGGGGGAMGGARTPSPMAALRSDSGLLDTVSDLRKSFSKMAENSAITNINMSDMHNIMARLVPLLLVFVGAMPVAITAMVGLATAAFAAAASLAAIAGFGALGLGLVDGQFDSERLADAFQDIKDAFIESFAPLAEALQPTFERGLAGLKKFFQAVGREGDALVALTDEARAFGGFVIDFVPDMLRTLASVVNGLASIFGNIGRWLENNFTDAMRSMVEMTAQAMPTFAEFVQIILSAIGPITRLSLGFMRVVNVIMRVIGAIGAFINWLGISWEVLGLVIGSLLTFISVAALGSSILGSVFVTAIVDAIVALGSYFLSTQAATEGTALFGGTLLGTVLTGLINFTANLIGSIAAMAGFTLTAYEAAFAAAAFWTALTLGAAIGLIAFVGAMASRFTDLQSSIDGATSSLQDFNNVQSGMDGAGFGGTGTSPYGFSPEGGSGGSRGGGSAGGTTFNVESSGNPDEDRSNLDHADWMSGRTTGR